MQRRYRFALPLLLLALTLSLPACPVATQRASGKARAASSIPAALQQLAEKATAAANTRQFTAFAGLVTGDASRQVAWIKETTTRHWEGGLLRVPGDSKDAASYLMVFTAWHTCESDGDHVHRVLKTPEGWKLGDEIPETDTGGFRVRDHDLRVRFNVPQKVAILTDTARIERIAGDAPPFCLLRLSSDFQVSAVQRNGSAVPFQQVGGIVVFAPPADKTFSLTLKYAGMVDHHGSDFVLPEEATLNSYWYPHTARQPATSTVTVVAPPGWTPLAQGELVRQQTGKDGATTVTYRNDIPNSFFTVDAGRYTVTTREASGRKLSVYLRAPNPTLAKQCLDELEHALAFYDANFSRFPYTRYGLVESKGPFGGALEAYSFATYGPGTLPGTIAHELAHTWWGGLIPCAYTRSMWNESFADYSDELFQRLGSKGKTAVGLEGMNRALRTKRPRATPFGEFPMTTAHDTSDDRQASVGYGKGALVLRVLEEQLGQETMLRCMRTFLADHKRGEAAEWPDFEAAVNKTTGEDYHWFFAQWTERTGVPVVRLENVKVQQQGSEYVIEADITQPGTPYRLKMPITLRTRGGDPVTQTLVVEGAVTHLQLRSTAPPSRLALDPDGVLPIGFPAASNLADGTDPTVYTFP